MKRFALLLSLFILLCGITFTASAIKADVPTSGTCGDSLSWSFDTATGTLTVTGTGSMKSRESSPYWDELKDDIVNVVIGEGCTSVSSHAFSGCHNLKSVSLPKSVTTIERYAFSSCWILPSISLTHVTSIGENAFYQCYALTELTIPQGVTTIGHGAFSRCSKLQTVNFHNNITEISGYAFKGCTSLTSVTIPNSVKTIGGSAFSGCKNLTEVHLGSGLTELGGNSFQDCVKLKSIRIPDKVTSIKINTFNSCTALEELYIGAGVSEFVVSAIEDCPNLKAFTLSSNNPYFKLDKGILYTKDGATLVCMPNGFTGAYTVLAGTKTVDSYSCRNTGLESITIPGSVTTVGSYTFIDCKKLHTINLAYGLQKIGDYAFARTAIKEIVIPESVTKMGGLTFYGSGNLRKITFLGNKPTTNTSSFDGLNATVYYPVGAPEWKDMPFVSGITWVAFTCDTHTVVNISAKNPTCTEDGNTAGSYCAVCKTVFTPWQTISKKDHAYGTWVITETTSTSFTKERTCANCGNKDVLTVNTGNSGQSTPQQNTTENTNPTQPKPTDHISSAPQSPTESVPAQDATEISTLATDASTFATDPTETPTDVGGNKNTLLFVGISLVLLGLATSGFFLFKSKKHT